MTPVPKRPKPLRSKDHRQFVASLPCLRCENSPCQAAHLRTGYATMSQKPGDDLTVPLCPACHRDQHHYGDEVLWWQILGINPQPIAARLWAVTGDGQAGWDIVRQARMAA